MLGQRDWTWALLAGSVLGKTGPALGSLDEIKQISSRLPRVKQFYSLYPP
jgi:hypothetical protein